MTPEERRIDKARRILRQRGTPSLLPADQSRQAIEKVRDFHARGMSVAEICEQTGMHKASVHDMCRGLRTLARDNMPVTRMRRTTYDAIMRMTFKGEAKYGARIPVLGIRRRLQALARLGFSQQFLGEEIGIGKARVSLLMNEDTGREYVYNKVFNNVCRVYDKLYMANPADFALGAQPITRARNYAENRGYAPPGCWDADTIDDPEAFPEWTGACGTYHGVNLHRKYDMPICQPCVDARNARRQELGYPSRRKRRD